MVSMRTFAVIGVVGVMAALQAASADTAEKPSISVLATSTGTGFTDTTTPLSITEYSGLLTSILGLSSPTYYNWNGLLPAGLFNRPRAVASIIVEGPRVSFDAPKTYSIRSSSERNNLYDALHALAGSTPEDPFATVPALVSDLFGSRATVISVSADGDAAKWAGLAKGDAMSHTVSVSGGKFTDTPANCDALTLPAAVDYTQFKGVSFVDGEAVVNGATFKGADLELFAELNAMLAVTKGCKNHADSHPAVLTFTVSKLSEIAARHGESSVVTAAAKAVVASAVQELASQISVAYGEKAVVFGVSLGADVTRTHPTRAEQMRVRRDAEMASETNSSNATAALAMPLKQYALYPEFFSVDSCSRYKCTCFAVYTAFQDTDLYKSTCGNNCYNFSQYNNMSFAVASSVEDKTTAGCISLDGGEGKLCAWDQAACDCSNEAFFEAIDGVSGVNFLYPGKKITPFFNASDDQNLTIQGRVSLRYAVGRNPNRRMSTDATCIHCAYGFTLSNGFCYEDNAMTASGQAALWVSLAGTAGLVGMWYVLHSITDGGKWAYLGEVPDVPDMKKTM